MTSDRVLVSLPTWAAGRDPAAFAQMAGWNAEAVKDGWLVQLKERRYRRSAGLVTSRRLGHSGTIDNPGVWAPLKDLPPQANFIREDLSSKVADFLRREPQQGLAGRLSEISLWTSVAPDAQLQQVVRAGLAHLLSAPRLGGGADVHLVRVHLTLAKRVTAARMLSQQTQPAAAAELEKLAARGGQVPERTPLAAARSLALDLTFGFDCYLAPLLLSVVPYFWGFAAPRIGGVVLYSLGTAIRAHEGQHSEPMQLLSPRLASGEPYPPRPDFAPAQLRAALSWYVEQLDLLLSAATDPVPFADHMGKYLPVRHLESLLSLELTFRSVQAVGAHSRDEHTRRVMGLGALDALHGLGLSQPQQLCSLSRARSALDVLERQVPAEAADVLLPRARAAVAALAQLQQGFLGANNGRVSVTQDDGSARSLTLEDAAADWLRMLRNADHHAFGDTKDRGRDRDVSLLLAHTGEVPRGVADLPWLWLLHLLNDPSQLKPRRSKVERLGP